MDKIEEFLDTLKIHNKDISCFNDHLAVFKLKRLIEAEITSAVSEAVEEERKCKTCGKELHKTCKECRNVEDCEYMFSNQKVK